MMPSTVNIETGAAAGAGTARCWAVSHGVAASRNARIRIRRMVCTLYQWSSAAGSKAPKTGAQRAADGTGMSRKREILAISIVGSANRPAGEHVLDHRQGLRPGLGDIEMRTHILRRILPRLAVTTAAAAVFAVAPLGAQSLMTSAKQAIQTPPPAAQAPAAQGPVLQLSIDQAVDMGLETSLGLKSDRLNVDIASQQIASAKSAFVPTVTAGFSGNTTQRQPTDFTQGSSDISSHNMGGTGSLDQLLPWFGNRYHVGWNASRVT